MITPDSFEHVLSNSEKQVSEKIKSYLQKPNEDNVHDLRTSIRRALATTSVLPKKIRKDKESRKYLDELKKLLKLNASVRDTDIVLSKLPNHGDSPEFSKLSKKLNAEREASLKKARRVASSLKVEKGPTLDVRDISSSTLQKRFLKTTNELTKKLREGLRLVKNEPKDIDQLHKLREDSRRLRYTLEIDDHAKSSKLLPVVEMWQDILGKIRDADIFITSVSREKTSPTLKEVLDREQASRKENYAKFLEIAKESPGLKYSLSKSDFGPD